MKHPFRNKEDRAGLYITIIFHLVVIIVLLAYQLDSALKREESFVLDPKGVLLIETPRKPKASGVGCAPAALPQHTPQIQT